VIENLLSLVFLAQVLRISVPYVLAALGGVYSERGGVVALGLEGQLLFGGFAGIVVTHATGSPALGLLGGVAAGVLLAAVLGLVALRLSANHIVAGVAVNLLAVGLTRFLLKLFFDSTSNSPRVDTVVPPSWARGTPLLELVSNPLFLLAVGLVIAGHLVLRHTPFGLRLQAVGEHPQAAETLGVRVMPLQWVATLLCGALAGLGGVWLAFEQNQFVDQMSGLRGYIALAAVIFGRWQPLGATLACLGFGFAEALQIALQTAQRQGPGGLQLPPQLIQSVPYLLTMVALAGLIGRSTPPAALGRTDEPSGH
jgi:simple sugar transport system permease protein